MPSGESTGTKQAAASSSEAALEGRFCPHCGGELAIKRQMTPGIITTYLLCYFCHWKRPTLRYDCGTRIHEELLVSTDG